MMVAGTITTESSEVQLTPPMCWTCWHRTNLGCTDSPTIGADGPPAIGDEAGALGVATGGSSLNPPGHRFVLPLSVE